jgi:glutamyl/glutaminyl-tRNA synthetase
MYMLKYCLLLRPKNLKKQAKETFHSTAEQAATIAKKANAGKLLIGHFSARYKDLTSLIAEAKLVFENTAAEKGIKPGEVLQLFRVIMSGQGSGVDLFGMVALLGKEDVLTRIAVAMDKLGNPAN